MSVPLHDAATSVAPATGTSRSLTLTCGAGVPVNGALLAFAWVDSVTDVVTGATNAGLYDADEIIRFSHDNTAWAYLFRWKASHALAGANAVLVSLSASKSIALAAWSFTNASQDNLSVTVPGGLTGTQVLSSTIPVIDDSLVGLFAANALEAPTVGPNNTARDLTQKRAAITQWTSAAAAGVEVYPWLIVSGSTDWLMFSFALAPYVSPVIPPSGTPNRTRDILIKPALPTLGSAGYQFQDPTFGTNMVRVTDHNTRLALDGTTYRSFSSPSNAITQGWNTNSTRFYALSNDGTVTLFSFNPTTRVPAVMGILAYNNEPCFSRTNPNYIYGRGSAYDNHQTIVRADVTTWPPTYTVAVDCETLIPALIGQGTYASQYTVEDPAHAGNDLLVIPTGGASQDLTHYVIRYPIASPGSATILNTLTRTEMFLTYGSGPYLHSSPPDLSGRWILMRVSAFQARSDASGLWLWDTQTDTMTQLTVTDGHGCLGYGYYINQVASSGTPDQLQWTKRSLSSPNSNLTVLISDVLRPYEPFIEDHSTVNNSTAANPYVPMTSIAYRYYDGPYDVDPLKNTAAWRALDDELYQVATDGSGRAIERYCHTRALVWAEPVGLRGGSFDFSQLPIPNVSQDGRFTSFGTNWEHTLGLDSYESNTKHRTDLVVVELQAPTVPTPPTPGFRRRRGRRMGSR